MTEDSTTVQTSSLPSQTQESDEFVEYDIDLSSHGYNNIVAFQVSHVQSNLRVKLNLRVQLNLQSNLRLVLCILLSMIFFADTSCVILWKTKWNFSCYRCLHLSYETTLYRKTAWFPCIYHRNNCWHHHTGHTPDIGVGVLRQISVTFVYINNVMSYLSVGFIRIVWSQGTGHHNLLHFTTNRIKFSHNVHIFNCWGQKFHTYFLFLHL